MNNLGIHTFTQLRDQKVFANYFVEGVHGNFLIGDASLIDKKAEEFIQAKGGLSRVINLLPPNTEAMKKCFSRFGCSEVRLDSFSTNDYPVHRFGEEFSHPSLFELNSNKSKHILLHQKERYVLFFDPQVEFRNHQLVTNLEQVELTQSLLNWFEKIDFCASFFAQAGGTFFPLLPGLLEKKMGQIES